MISPKVSWTRGPVPSVPSGNWVAAQSRKKEEQTEALCRPLQVWEKSVKRKDNVNSDGKKPWYLAGIY